MAAMVSSEKTDCCEKDGVAVCNLAAGQLLLRILIFCRRAVCPLFPLSVALIFPIGRPYAIA